MRKQTILLSLVVLILLGLTAKNLYHRWASNALLEAAQNHDDAAIQSLLRRGAGVDRRDEDNSMTPLMWAIAKKCNETTIRALIEAGSDLNAVSKNGSSVLGSESGSPALLSYMIYKGAKSLRDNQDTTLIVAAEKCDAQTVKWLLQRGADPLKSDSKGETPLSGTIGSQDIEKVRLIIEAGGYQPKGIHAPEMWLAAYRGNIALLSLLKQHGGDINGGDPKKVIEVLKNYGSFHDPNFEPPIQVAIKKHDVPLVKWFLANGADPNIKVFSPSGAYHLPTTSLALAEKLKYSDIVTLLKHHGAGMPPKN